MKEVSIVKLLHIVGARPQFIKYYPIQRAMDLAQSQTPTVSLASVLVHTGQHYDYRMSQIFFDELGIRSPDYHLNVGSGSHGQQTALVQQRAEEVFVQEKPDIVVVFGDTNSTLGAALAAVKLHIPIAHVEAGLRSFNKRMPEEVNRVLTDHIATYLFCPSETAVLNLRDEGVMAKSGDMIQIYQNSGSCPQIPQVSDIDHPLVIQVGDVMYDMLLHALSIAKEQSHILDQLNIEPKGYDLLTLHRAETTDDPQRLEEVITFVNEISTQTPVIFPMHPRMAKAYARVHKHFAKNVSIIEPLGYFDLLKALENACRLLTDSGGMQKEAYWLQIPCITLRDQTEWVETVQSGWNIFWRDYCGEHHPQNQPHAYGDGRAATKIIETLLERNLF
jgi:UDP-GlcNAc3NAcA epimerase